MCSCLGQPIPKRRCLSISCNEVKGTCGGQGGKGVCRARSCTDLPLSQTIQTSQRFPFCFSWILWLFLSFLFWVRITRKWELICGPTWHKIVYGKWRHSRALFKRKLFCRTPLRHLCECMTPSGGKLGNGVFKEEEVGWLEGEKAVDKGELRFRETSIKVSSSGVPYLQWINFKKTQKLWGMQWHLKRESVWRIWKDAIYHRPWGGTPSIFTFPSNSRRISH